MAPNLLQGIQKSVSSFSHKYICQFHNQQIKLESSSLESLQMKVEFGI